MLKNNSPQDNRFKVKLYSLLNFVQKSSDIWWQPVTTHSKQRRNFSLKITSTTYFGHIYTWPRCV